MNLYYIAAAIMSAVTFFLHITIGGRAYVKPILGSENLGKTPKYAAYYCWHLVSITLAGIALAFWMAAMDPANTILAIFASVGATTFAVWSLIMILTFKLRFRQFPQWALFIPAALLGFAGLII